MPAKSLELRHTIHLITELSSEIEEIEAVIQSIMYELHSPITTIPGIGFRMGAIILTEIGDFSHFDSSDKIIAYSGMSSPAYQSGQLTNGYARMEKCGLSMRWRNTVKRIAWLRDFCSIARWCL